MKIHEAAPRSTHASAPAAAPADMAQGQSATLKSQARGLGFAEGEALLTPPASNASAQSKAANNGPTSQDPPTGKESGGQGDGRTMGQNLVEHMRELNKSPALKDSEGSGKYNVGYRPGFPVLPDGTKVVTTPGTGKNQSTVELQFPARQYENEEARSKGEQEEHDIRVAYMNALTYKNGRVVDGQNDDGEFTKYFAEQTPSEGSSFSWSLKNTKLASEALDQWLRTSGSDPTIAECASALTAIQLQTLREKVGDATFNKIVSTSGAPYFIAPNPKDTPLEKFLSEIELYSATDKGEVGNRPLKEGDAVYFANHPDYSKHDKNGLWAGENCIYMGTNEKGEQLFSGFGLTARTELQILEALAKHYNEAATLAKAPAITATDILANGGGLQTKFEPDSGEKLDQKRANAGGLRLDDAKVDDKVRSLSRTSAKK